MPVQHLDSIWRNADLSIIPLTINFLIVWEYKYSYFYNENEFVNVVCKNILNYINKNADPQLNALICVKLRFSVFVNGV